MDDDEVLIELTLRRLRTRVRSSMLVPCFFVVIVPLFFAILALAGVSFPEVRCDVRGEASSDSVVDVVVVVVRRRRRRGRRSCAVDHRAPTARVDRRWRSARADSSVADMA